jgi:hypothetical protein
LAAGVALACKQTTYLFGPLLFALLAIRIVSARYEKNHNLSLGQLPRLLARPLLRLIAPLVVVTIAITIWDSVRDAPIGFWSQGFSDNAPSGLVPLSGILPRLFEMVRLFAYALASPAVNLLGAAGLILLILAEYDRLHEPRVQIDAVLLLFIAGYIGIYSVFALNLWDRYLLALVPMLCLLLARAFVVVGGVAAYAIAARRAAAARTAEHPAITRRRWLPAVRATTLAGLVALLTPAGLVASVSGYPVGGDHGAHDGIDEVAAFLDQAPPGSVLYDRWLSWELRYYLGDASIYLVWVPDPAHLATDLRAFGRLSPRYFVSPTWESDDEYRRLASQAGFEFRPAHVTYQRTGRVSFIVYEVAPHDS